MNYTKAFDVRLAAQGDGRLAIKKGLQLWKHEGLYEIEYK